MYLYLYKDLSLCVHVHAWMRACGVNCVRERALDVCVFVNNASDGLQNVFVLLVNCKYVYVCINKV